MPVAIAWAAVHAVLPQTQCQRCGLPDCEAYARAIVAGEAQINQCPPGGEEGIRRLAAVTGLAPLALNPANGVEGPRSMAWVDETWCIGCTLCIAACPTDAIVGTNKAMHTVVVAHCTGCELCLPACPVDCIHMEAIAVNGPADAPIATGWTAWSAEAATAALTRYQSRAGRIAAR